MFRPISPPSASISRTTWPLAGPDGRIAGHVGDGIQTQGEQQRGATHPGRGQSRLTSGMTRTDYDHIIFSRKITHRLSQTQLNKSRRGVGIGHLPLRPSRSPLLGSTLAPSKEFRRKFKSGRSNPFISQTNWKDPDQILGHRLADDLAQVCQAFFKSISTMSSGTPDSIPSMASPHFSKALRSKWIWRELLTYVASAAPPFPD